MEHKYEFTREKVIHEKFDYNFKVTLAGKKGAGKTSLIKRITEDKFSESYAQTMAGDAYNIFYEVKKDKTSKNLKLAFWDTSGEEQYLSITKLYFKGAHAVLIVYDITDKESLLQLEYWIKGVNDCVSPMTRLYLIGSKNDLVEKRKVDIEEVEDLAAKINSPLLEVSSKTGDGIEELVNKLIQDLIDNRAWPRTLANLRDERRRLSSYSTQKKKCC